MQLGLACHVCGQLNRLESRACDRCGTGLVPAASAPQPAAAATGVPPGLATSTPFQGSAPEGTDSAPAPAAGMGPVQQRFDPATGQPLTPEGDQMPPAKTLFFGALQQEPVVPRLVVIKGEGGDGATYHLQGTTTIVGRKGADIAFPDDPFLGSQHARFTSQEGRLFVQDVGTVNGVFLRIKSPTPLEHDANFLVGEQLLRLDTEKFSDGSPNADGTYFYGSPRPDGAFRVVQALAGGGEGRTCTANGRSLTLGREGNDFDFPDDRFISGHHARLDADSDSDRVTLTDMGSRNGTFARIEEARELFHGDYLFVGQQLLRVEIT